MGLDSAHMGHCVREKAVRQGLVGAAVRRARGHAPQASGVKLPPVQGLPVPGCRSAELVSDGSRANETSDHICERGSAKVG